MRRVLAFAFVALSCAGAALSFAAASGCLTSPPPDLAQPPIQRPTFVHDALQPPPGQILGEIPAEFILPVALPSTDPSFYFNVFVDYNPCADPTNCTPSAPVSSSIQISATPGSLDGGVYTEDWGTGGAIDPTACHVIQILVAHQFNASSPHTWDSVGGDIATWIYVPGGSPGGCPVYDAGAVQDGAFPPADAGNDGILVTPESGAGDP
jgi:hypothetical protein